MYLQHIPKFFSLTLKLPWEITVTHYCDHNFSVASPEILPEQLFLNFMVGAIR